MTDDAYACLRIVLDHGVATVTIDHPPVNLLDLPLLMELDRLERLVREDPAVRVVVVQSTNPEFFLGHVDLGLLLDLPAIPAPKPVALPFFTDLLERWRTVPKATIARIEGRTHGGGAAFASSLDMRFAALGRAVVGQPEVGLGIIPGGGGTQRLGRLLGRGRALEAILGCEDLSADLAERYGFVNRAVPAAALGPFVERLARRIASFPPAAVALAKAALEAAEPPVGTLLDEADHFNQAVVSADARERMARLLGRGGQTREGELELAGLLQELA